MTFNEGADVSNTRARRKGRTAAAVGGGAVGLGAIAVLIISLLTGGDVDLSGLVGGGGTDGNSSGTSAEGDALVDCKTGADANEDDACRLGAGQLALDQFWAENVEGYTEPGITIVDGSTQTPCGTASNQTGPFYCPTDQGVYIDPTFFGLLRSQFGASGGDLAQLYVLAHEWGHHIQNITGIMAENPNNGTGPTSNGVRIELQADCFAGAWVGAMTEQKDANGVAYLKAPTNQEIADAINAAETVGDDHIQEQSTGQVNPESWTHGSSEQRKEWFMQGYESGLNTCDTFGAL